MRRMPKELEVAARALPTDASVCYTRDTVVSLACRSYHKLPCDQMETVPELVGFIKPRKHNKNIYCHIIRI